MNYFKAIDGAGRVYTRSSATRDYGYAVVGGGWNGRESWTSRLDLARKLGGTDETILVADRIDAHEYRAILKANKEAGR